jgi:hypothetical protein
MSAQAQKLRAQAARLFAMGVDARDKRDAADLAPQAEAIPPRNPPMPYGARTTPTPARA